MALVSIQRAAVVFDVTDKTVRDWVRTGRIYARRDNRSVRVDLSTLGRPNRWNAPRHTAPANPAWFGVRAAIGRYGSKACTASYLRLLPYQREELDAWCAANSKESPSAYCDPAKLVRCLDF